MHTTTEISNRVTTESHSTTPIQSTEEMAVSSTLESTVSTATTKYSLDYSTISQTVHCMSI